MGALWNSPYRWYDTLYTMSGGGAPGVAHRVSAYV